VVFNLLEVNMIGSRVTVDTPRERKQLGAFGKMSGLSSRLFLFFPAPFYYLCPSHDSCLPERKWKRLLRKLEGGELFLVNDVLKDNKLVQYWTGVT